MSQQTPKEKNHNISFNPKNVFFPVRYLIQLTLAIAFISIQLPLLISLNPHPTPICKILLVILLLLLQLNELLYNLWDQQYTRNQEIYTLNLMICILIVAL